MSLDLSLTAKRSGQVSFDRNITHNHTRMAEIVPCGDYNLYRMLWHPADDGFYVLTIEYRALVAQGLAYMICNRRELEKLNPSNGWGSYDGLLDFVSEYCMAMSTWDGEEEIEINAWT